jgi:isocitrate dehydrogenase (NAD+)
MNRANPTALILSGVLMLRHLGHPEAANRVEGALRDVVADGRTVTADLGGSAGTSQFADAIVERLHATAGRPPTARPAAAAPLGTA